MAYIKEITIGMETSIKMAEYQYKKPRLDIKVILEEGDDFKEVLIKAKQTLKEEIKRIENEF